MKKRLLVVFALLIVFSACACNKKNTDFNDATTGVENATLEPVKEIKGTKVESVPGLLDLGEVFNVDQYTLDEVMVYSDELLLIVNRQETIGNMKVRLYNIYTGEFTYEYNYSYPELLYYEVEILSDGRVAVCNYANVDIIILNKELKEESKIAPMLNMESSYTEYVISGDGKNIYYFEKTATDITFKKYEIESGKSTDMVWDEAFGIVSTIKKVTDDDKYLMINALYDKSFKYVLYNTQNSSYYTYEGEEYAVIVDDDIVIYYDYVNSNEYRMVIDPTKPRLSYYIKLDVDINDEYGASVRAVSNNSIVSVDVEKNGTNYKNIFKQYDITTGNVIRQFEITDALPYMCNDAQLFNQGKMMLIKLDEGYCDYMDFTGKSKAYIWMLEEEN